jgi:hypothetical protein
MKPVIKYSGPEARSYDEKTRTIWHKISKEIVDRMGDIVRIDGLDLKNFKKKPAVLYGHLYQGVDPLPIIAENVGFDKKGDELWAGTQFLDTKEINDPKLKNLINDLWYLNKKKLMGWSIGFMPLAHEFEELKDEDGNVTGWDFKKGELLEYSNVTIPANQAAVNDAVRKGVIHTETIDRFKSVESEPKWTPDPEPEKPKDVVVQVIAGGQGVEITPTEPEPKELVEKPYPNEHACRLEDPDKYDRFTRGTRKHEGKEYSIIFGWREQDGKEVSEEQAYRYKKDIWTAAEARAHCKDHSGTFEAASGKECEPCKEGEAILTAEEIATKLAIEKENDLQAVKAEIIKAIKEVFNVIEKNNLLIAKIKENFTEDK